MIPSLIGAVGDEVGPADRDPVREALDKDPVRHGRQHVRGDLRLLVVRHLDAGDRAKGGGPPPLADAAAVGRVEIDEVDRAGVNQAAHAVARDSLWPALIGMLVAWRTCAILRASSYQWHGSSNQRMFKGSISRAKRTASPTGQPRLASTAMMKSGPPPSRAARPAPGPARLTGHRP